MQVLTNPFEEIYIKLQTLEQKVDALNNVQHPPSIEIIDRSELEKRLDITEPTAITWGKRGIIPELRIGSNVRYNWSAVVASLEKNGKR